MPKRSQFWELSPQRYPDLDSLRGLAALFVLISHVPGLVPENVQPQFGSIGVWLFFVLSGFLLSSPFIEKRESIHPSSLFPYFIRRLFRILPLYYFVVPFYYPFLGLKCGNFLLWVSKHYEFVWADRHFWTLPQEMLFYLALPAVLLIAMLPKKPITRALLLILLVTASIYFFEIHRLFQHIGQRPRIGPFLLGILVATLPAAFAKPVFFKIGFVGAILFAFFGHHLQSPLQTLTGIQGTVGWEYAYLSWPFAFLMVLGAIAGQNWLLSSPLFRRLGVIGFGFYLWQYFWIFLLKDDGLNPIVLTAVVFVCTFGSAFVTYQLIESPFLQVGRQWAEALRIRFSSTAQGTPFTR